MEDGAAKGKGGQLLGPQVPNLWFRVKEGWGDALIDSSGRVLS